MHKPWGYYATISKSPDHWVKILQINPNSSLSLQKHKDRLEHWVCVKGSVFAHRNDGKAAINKKLNPGDYFLIGKGDSHRLSNPNREPAVVIEVAYGKPDEDDIERIQDDYGRVGSDA